MKCFTNIWNVSTNIYNVSINIWNVFRNMYNVHRIILNVFTKMWNVYKHLQCFYKHLKFLYKHLEYFYKHLQCLYKYLHKNTNTYISVYPQYWYKFSHKYRLIDINIDNTDSLYIPTESARKILIWCYNSNTTKYKTTKNLTHKYIYSCQLVSSQK